MQVAAPAKLTLSLGVTGVRPDGYHLISSEMVTLDLADTVQIGPGSGLTIESAASGGSPVVSLGSDNLVNRALAALEVSAEVHLVKRIPVGAGLGGGSADAAAVFRWAGVDDVDLAASLGADVPFCLRGGRALVTGIGERVQPLDFEPRAYVLLLLPFGVSTAAVYRTWDDLHEQGQLPDPSTVTNQLEAPAVAVEPRLSQWKDVFAETTGVQPQLAGSGSTWFVEGTLAEVGLEGRGFLTLGSQHASLVPVRTTEAIPRTVGA